MHNHGHTEPLHEFCHACGMINSEDDESNLVHYTCSYPNPEGLIEVGSEGTKKMILVNMEINSPVRYTLCKTIQGLI